MNILVNGNPSERVAFYNTQPAARTKPQTSSRTGGKQDAVEISPEARAAMIKETGAVSPTAKSGRALFVADFTSFSTIYSKLVQDYDQTVRNYYREAHQENMGFEDPAHHIWEKYKDQTSDCFRSDLSELERAWAYDQEMDLALRGGKNMNLTDPYAFQSDVPSLKSTVIQANQAVRSQIDGAVGRLFRQAGVPKDASLRLSVDAEAHHITVSGLDNEALTSRLEDALNQGDNGKNLYEHIRLCDPTQFGGKEQEQYITGTSLSLDYRDGRLMDLDGSYGYGPGQTGWQSNVEVEDCDLDEFKDVVGPAWTRLWGAYDPQQGPLDNWSFMHSQGVNHGPEWEARVEAGIRATLPAELERFTKENPSSMKSRIAELEQQLREAQGSETAQDSNGSKKIDPETKYKVGIKAYMESIITQWQEEEAAIKSYYAAGIAENRTFDDPLAHIARKYCGAFAASNLLYFRADLSLAARKMAARQEYAIMMGGSIKHNDPYALAAVGGAKTQQKMDAIARKYAESVLEAMSQREQ